MPDIVYSRFMVPGAITYAGSRVPGPQIKVRRIATPGMQGPKAATITGPWDMTPAGPAPVSCHFPLGATEAEVQSFNFAGRLDLSNGEQTGSMFTIGALDRQLAALPTNPLTAPATFDILSGKKVIEWLFVAPALAGADGFVELSATVAGVEGGVPLQLRLRRYPGQASTAAVRVSLDGSPVFDQDLPMASGVLVVGAEFAAGSVRVKAGGQWLGLSTYNYAGTSEASHFMVGREVDLAEEDEGRTYSITARTAATSITQQYADDATDLCGHPVVVADADLPTGVKAGDLYEVSVAGRYAGVSFEEGDLALVRSDGVSVTRLPAASVSAADIAALRAQDILNDPAETGAPGGTVGDSLGNLQGQIDDLNDVAVGLSQQDAALQGQIDLKLDAAAYVQRFKGKYVSEAALSAALPTGADGDYAIVDGGAGEAARQFVWDAESGWVDSGALRSGTTTDQIAEGSANLWFTFARVRSTLLTGLSLAYGGAISATDTVLSALGKLQAFITATQAQIDLHAGSTSNPHGVTVQQLVTSSAWASFPAASSVADGTLRRATDVGSSGTLFISDTVRWRPVNGEACIFRDAVARGIAPSGTIGTGSSGHLTLGTALPRTYSEGIWLYLPAIATTPAVSAGLYWCVMSGTTAGTIYSNGPGSSAINFTAGASYSAPLTEVTLVSQTILGGLMGQNGHLRTTTMWGNSNSANAKSLRLRYGGSLYLSWSVTTSTFAQNMVIVRNVNSESFQKGASSSLPGAFGGGGGAALTSSVNSANDQALVLAGLLTNAADVVILESYSVELLR